MEVLEVFSDRRREISEIEVPLAGYCAGGNLLWDAPDASIASISRLPLIRT